MVKNHVSCCQRKSTQLSITLIYVCLFFEILAPISTTSSQLAPHTKYQCCCRRECLLRCDTLPKPIQSDPFTVSSRISRKMVLTDRQRADLHAGIYEYLLSQKDEKFHLVAQALKEADPQACQDKPTSKASPAPILEKKWTAVIRLQKKVLELEKAVAQSATIHAHRTTVSTSSENGSGRRMLPRMPPTHTLQGHSSVVTCVRVHPVYTMVASASEDGTIKVRTVFV